MCSQVIELMKCVRIKPWKVKSFFCPLIRHRMDGKAKVHQPGYVLFSQYACIETWVCPLPCDRVDFVSLSIYFLASRGYPQRGHQSMSMSVVMLPYCALEMHPRSGWAALTPHHNWITYFHSLLTYLFAHW